MLREVREETGLVPESFEFAFRYESLADVPVRIAVFYVQASGQLRGSWEGSADWFEINDLEGILPSQKYIVEEVLKTPLNPIG